MRTVLLALLVLVAFVGVQAVELESDACGGKDYGESGVFDFYVFAQSWPAQFCTAHMDWPGCAQPTAWQRVNLTLHGMWPNYAKTQGTHNWPQCCQSTRYGFDIDPKVVSQLLPALKVYWPNEQDPSGSDLSSSLWGHEWQKHGTCSGMDQKSYLTEAMSIELSMGTPAVLTQNVGGAAPLTELMAGFKASGCVKGQPCMAGLQCQYSGGQQWLAGVTTCWTKDFQRFPCPAAVIQNGGCTNSKIYIRSY